MYKKVIWSNRKPKEQQPDTLYLSSKDINHTERIFSKYKFESYFLDIDFKIL